MNGDNHTERAVQYKNNPAIEGKKRLNMAYLLLENPQMIETIKKSGGYFFHGTNANALPYILKYGLNSLDTSVKNNIVVNTGEQWSRMQGKRNFVSLTDCLDVAMQYANMQINNGNIDNSLNFGVVLGTSLERMEGIKTLSVISDIPEIGIAENMPLDHIKFLAVSEDKVEFVKKMLDSKNIEIISLNMQDEFYYVDFAEKFKILEQKSLKEEKQPYPEYTKSDVIPVVKERRTFNIKEILKSLKQKIFTKETKERK